MSNMSHVPYLFCMWQSCDASRWRFCYHLILPCLGFNQSFLKTFLGGWLTNTLSLWRRRVWPPESVSLPRQSHGCFLGVTWLDSNWPPGKPRLYTLQLLLILLALLFLILSFTLAFSFPDKHNKYLKLSSKTCIVLCFYQLFN